MIEPTVGNEDSLAIDEPTANDEDCLAANEPTAKDEDEMTVMEAEFLDFLATIQSQVDLAVNLWRDLILTQRALPLAAVSLAANTYPYEVVTMVHAAEILQPSLFRGDLNLTGKCDYCTRLNNLRSGEAVERIFAIFAEPADKCRISARQAHMPYQFLGLDYGDGLMENDPEEGYRYTGKPIPLRSAIVFEYAYQVHSLYADSEDIVISSFKNQIEMLISDTDTLLQETAEARGGTNLYATQSKAVIEQMEAFAEKARDILSLGYVAEMVECPRIHCIVELLGCPLVRLFAYSYECLRLGQPPVSHILHARLEEFILHPVVNDLLWPDGRPQSLANCGKLFPKYFASKSILQYQKFIHRRIASTLQKNCLFLSLRAQFANSLEERGFSLYRMTNDLSKMLRGVSLVEHLANDVLRFIGVSRIRRELITIIRLLTNRKEHSLRDCLTWLQEFLVLRLRTYGNVGLVAVDPRKVNEVIEYFPVD